MTREIERDLAKLANAFFEELKISNCEFGAIGVDCKRPFGNSNVEGDILDIIGWEMEGDDGYDTCHSSEQRAYAYELYHEKLIPFLQNEWKAKHEI